MARLRRLFWRLWPHHHTHSWREGPMLYRMVKNESNRTLTLGDPVYMGDVKPCCQKCGKIIGLALLLLLLCGCRATWDNAPNGGGKVEGVIGCPANPCQPEAKP